MTKQIFEENRKKLMELIEVVFSGSNITSFEKVQLKEVISILELYTYENRINKKGLLSHTVIDSLDLDEIIGTACITFDTGIN